MKPVIKLRNLTKYYGKQRGIENLNLEVKEGEVFGFLGPNGAGKTTTIKLLLNFIYPSDGNCSVFGLDPTKEISAILKNVGYLPGEIHLYDNLTGREHLRYQASLRTDVAWPYVTELAARFSANLDKPIKALSHGNKQKIALIAAFMARPKLLILDEPTTGLDPLIQREFYDLVAEVNKAGSTFFISSHILPEVERTCHRVSILKEGHLMITEEIEILKERAVRSLEIHFANLADVKNFKEVKGVKSFEISKNIVHCQVEGSLDSLIKQIAKYNVANIITQEADLESVFLNYYKKDNNVA